MQGLGLGVGFDRAPDLPATVAGMGVSITSRVCAPRH
jgi:hypothetical protein